MLAWGGPAPKKRRRKKEEQKQEAGGMTQSNLPTLARISFFFLGGGLARTRIGRVAIIKRRSMGVRLVL